MSLLTIATRGGSLLAFSSRGFASRVPALSVAQPQAQSSLAHVPGSDAADASTLQIG
jgi:hypothetical protein